MNLLLPLQASWNKTPASWLQLLKALRSSSRTRQSSAVPAPSQGLPAAQHCRGTWAKTLGNGPSQALTHWLCVTLSSSNGPSTGKKGAEADVYKTDD